VESWSGLPGTGALNMDLLASYFAWSYSINILIRVLFPALVSPIKDTSCGYLIWSGFGESFISCLKVSKSCKKGPSSWNLSIPKRSLACSSCLQFTVAEINK